MSRDFNARSSQRKPMGRFQLGLILVIAILVVSGAIVLLAMLQNGGHSTQKNSDRQKAAYFGVKSVEVVGTTRYKKDSIAGVSGIYIGQSVISVNKKIAAQNVLQSFPYIRQVEIDNSPNLNVIRIQVKEQEAIGALYDDGHWVIIGENGKVVERLPVTSSYPNRYLYIRGLKPEKSALGQSAMDDRHLEVIKSIRSLCEKDKFTTIGTIDLASLSDIQLVWDNRITVRIGNESNLSHQMAVLRTVLPKIAAAQGENATGVLDMRTYSDGDAGNDYAVFTPQDILDSRKAAEEAAAAKATAKTATAKTTAKTTKAVATAATKATASR